MDISERSPSQVPRATFTEIPLGCFNVVAKNVQDRLIICSSISSYVEDIAECENIIGKQLSKVGVFIVNCNFVFPMYAVLQISILNIAVGNTISVNSTM